MFKIVLTFIQTTNMALRLIIFLKDVCYHIKMDPVQMVSSDMMDTERCIIQY